MADVRASSGAPTAASFGGIGAPTLCAPLIVDSATGNIYSIKTGDVVVPFGAGGVARNSVPAGDTFTVPAGYSLVTTGAYVVTGTMVVLGDWKVI